LFDPERTGYGENKMSLKEDKPGTAFNSVVGADPAAPIGPFCEPPYELTSTIHSAMSDVSGDMIRDSDAELRMILALQSCWHQVIKTSQVLLTMKVYPDLVRSSQNE
jgi:hypothetical protein